MRRVKREHKREPLPLLQTGVGTVLSSMAISGFILGFAADQVFDTTPIFLLLFGFLGVAGGTMKAHKFLQAVPKKRAEQHELAQRTNVVESAVEKNGQKTDQQ